MPVEALVATNVGGVKDRKRMTWKAPHVYFVGGEPGRSVDGYVVDGLDVRQEHIPVVLVFVAVHGQY